MLPPYRKAEINKRNAEKRRLHSRLISEYQHHLIGDVMESFRSCPSFIPSISGRCHTLTHVKMARFNTQSMCQFLGTNEMVSPTFLGNSCRVRPSGRATCQQREKVTNPGGVQPEVLNIPPGGIR